MANGNLIEKLRVLLLLCRELADRHPDDPEITRIADEIEALILASEANSGPDSGSPLRDNLNVRNGWLAFLERTNGTLATDLR
jgi:hypothetical protein